MPHLPIQNAAVIGAGTMGAQIAALLASVGIPVLLLDVAPTELTAEEGSRGLTLSSPPVRNRLVRSLFERMKKLSPPAFFTPEAAALVTLGNIEDNLPDLVRADWIVEAILDRMELKQSLHARIAPHVRADAIVTTNTSGLPLHRMLESLPASYRRRCFAAHFFNPPRYLRLLEIVPIADTDPLVLRDFRAFAEAVLGKGVVVAKDTPCFIANRIGCFDLLSAFRLAHSEGLSVEEVDALTGPLIGRPASGTFRLTDIVGIDLLAQLGRNLRELLPAEAERFAPPPFLDEVLRRGWFGEKSGRGFYWRRKTDQGRAIDALDLRSLEYRPAKPPAWPDLAALSSTTDTAARVHALCAQEGEPGRFAWRHLSAVLCYAADLIPEIAEDVVAIDEAMRWGYNWELGPFQLWDALGVAEVARRLQAEGRAVPNLVTALLKEGHDHFYQKRGATWFHYASSVRGYASRNAAPKAVSLNALRDADKIVQSNAAATLIDLGEGVACLEFHSKLNTIGDATLAQLREALQTVRRDFAGLVIGNQGTHFSAGADLKEFAGHIEAGRWAELEGMLRRFQAATSTLRFFPRPVVAAVHGYTLGGGCEIALGCDHVVAFVETTMGLPEVGVGLIPGAHGTKEMLVRCTEGIPRTNDPDYFAGTKMAWETLAQARLSTSAPEAARMRYLRPGEWTLVMNREWLLGEAMAKVLQLADGYRARPPRTDIPAVGQSGLATLRATLHAMRVAGQIGEHDVTVGTKLAHILCGGDLTGLHFVSENYLLELEREAFLSLCGEPATQARIRHMLATGKRLKN